MPLLLRELAISGSRKSDGAPNASGLVFLYSPGTTATVSGWKDEAMTQSWPTTGGAIQLDASGKAVIWVAGRVDVLIQDSSGGTIASLLGYADSPATTVTVANSGFSGSVTDQATGNVTQGAGGTTTLDATLTSAASSFGGIDYQFLESTGGVGMKYVDVVRAIQLIPQMFGAKGDGVTDDTTAIQKAINRLVALGGGVLFFPPPQNYYKISSVLSVPSATGVLLAGCGPSKSVIQQTVGSSALTVAASFGFAMRDLGITGGGVDCSAGLQQPIRFDNVSITATGATALKMGTAIGVYLRDVSLSGSVCLSLSGSSVVWMRGGGMNASSICVDILGTSHDVNVRDAEFSGPTGLKWEASSTGVGFSVSGCRSLGDGSVTTPFDTSAISADPLVVQSDNLFDADFQQFAAPATVVPRLIAKATVLKATSGGGSTVTVSLPPAPASGWGRSPNVELRLVNASGGLITWSFAGGYLTSGAAPTANGSQTSIGLWWNGAFWVERYRGTV